MGHSTYIGRIGALAFALGVGVGLGATPAVAFADETGTSASSPAGENTTSGPGTAADAPTETDVDEQDEAAVDEQDEAAVDEPEQPAEENDADAVETVQDRQDRIVDTDPEPVAASDDAPETEPEPEPDVDEAVTAPEDAPTGDPAPDVAPPTGPEADTVAEIPSPGAEPVEAPASTSVTLSTILSSLLAPPRTPDVPSESPLWLVVAAALRRQLDSPTTSGEAGLSSTLLTPEEAEAIRRLGDIVTGPNPTDVVSTDTRAYVAHPGSRSITVIDTVNGTVLQTISLWSTPTKLALSPGGGRLYISNALAGTVSVISTATNSVIKTIRVGDTPTGIAVSPGGTRVYVVNSDDGTVSKISTLTNKVVGTVYGVGKGVSTITVSPDGATIYALNGTAGEISHFSAASLFAGKITGVTPGSQGITFSTDGSRVFVADLAGSVKVIDTDSHEVVDSIILATGAPFDLAVSPDGTTLFVARSGDGKLSVYDIATKTELTSIVANPYLVDGAPTISASPDGTQLYWTDSGSDRVHVIALLAPNGDPVAGTPVVNAPNASGAVTGSVTVTDPEGRPLTYTVSTPDKGAVTVSHGENGDFVFTYTPTAAARHAAAAVSGAPGAAVDTFTITFSDGRRGVVTVPITVTIAPANAAPTATARSSLSWFSPKVYGTVTAKDADKDTLGFTASPTAKGGTVTIDGRGRFTYTPSDAARHVAAAEAATREDKQDTFDVVIDDGHGGVATVAVTVNIKPANAAPTDAATADVFTNPNSGVITGKITAVDTDSDAVTYRAAPATSKGVVSIDADGTFTYVPTAEARTAASRPFAPSWDKNDRFRVTVDDGHGGTTTLTVRVAIARLGHVNQAPTNGSYSVGQPNPASGKVAGTVSATDPERDAVTFAGSGVTGKGSVIVDAAGGFVYTPSDEARHRAGADDATQADKQDTFTVTAVDFYGAKLAVPVTVTIVGLTAL